MTEEHWADALARMIDARVAGEPLPAAEGELTEPSGLAGLVEAIAADAPWDRVYGAPPAEFDPVAAMLDLVPDRARSLDGDALERSLRESGLQAGDLADALSAREWDVAPGNVLDWMAGDNETVPPALIQAIAETVRVAPEKLMVDRSEAKP